MNEIDFIPEHYRKAQHRHRRIVREAAMLLVVAAAMAGWHWTNGRRLAELEMLAAIARDHAQATQSQLQDMAKLERRRETILRQTQVQRELGLPIGVTPAVSVLASLMPSSMAATHLSVTTPRPKPEPKVVAIPGRPAPAAPPASVPAAAPEPVPPMLVELTGLAPDDMAVAEFVGRVSSHPLFANVKMSYSRATQSRGLKGREFRIEMEIPLDRDYHPAKSAGEVAHAN